MKTIGFFDTKPYDKIWFDRLNQHYHIRYFEHRLTPETAVLSRGCDGVIAFVNDQINEKTITDLCNVGVQVLALRCAGYNNVDIKSAKHRLPVLRVPAYSPYAVAEHAFALLLTLNRKVHKAYIRTRDFNFSLNGLIGMDLHDKTLGIIGTGKIGKVMAQIGQGFGMKILAYDPVPDHSSGIDYVPLPTLLEQSDVLSLHCPLTHQTYQMLNETTLAATKKGVIILNTSRGKLIDSEALLNALNSGHVKAAGLDVYEEEADVFFEDVSDTPLQDETLSLLVSRPNVIITSHQAFLTEEALFHIAEVTLANLDAFFSGADLPNQIHYQPKGT